jgi:hypothetical protein
MHHDQGLIRLFYFLPRRKQVFLMCVFFIHRALL